MRKGLVGGGGEGRIGFASYFLKEGQGSGCGSSKKEWELYVAQRNRVSNN